MNILVVSSNYPSVYNPNHGAFVYNLMQELAKEHRITVISPLKYHHLLKKKQKTYGPEKCEVYRPLYVSLSKKKIGRFNTGKLSGRHYRKAIHSVLKTLPQKPDLVYTHFLSNALSVLEYAETNEIPLVVASGESTYDSWVKKPIAVQTKLKKLASHIICVSQENQTQLTAIGFDNRKMTVVPNAVDYTLFKPLDKNACKKKLNIESSTFVVGFIGHFIHRKGPNRVIEAIKTLEDKTIRLVCIGNGGSLIQNTFTTALKPLPNYLLPELYNAFDVFVLPTLNEGHCNVIEEAKACGIPIISSKGTSVEEQIDETTGVLVDPLNTRQIAKAIARLKDDLTLREHVAENLTQKRGENSMTQRAEKIGHILKSIG